MKKLSMFLVFAFLFVNLGFSKPADDTKPSYTKEEVIEIYQELIGDNDFLLLDFYKNKCYACNESWKNLPSLSRTLKDDYVITIPINIDKKKSDATEWIKENYPEWESVFYYDENKMIARYMNIKSVPTLILLHKDDLGNKEGIFKKVGTFKVKETLKKIHEAIDSIPKKDQ